MHDATPYKLDRTKFPGLTQLADSLRTNHRFAADIVDRGAALFGAPWATEFERVLSALFPTTEAIAAAVKGYATFAMHSMRLQAVFERDRQLQFFDSAFVQAMRVAGATSFMEVGIGTGLYSSLLLRKLPSVRGIGLDISPSSKLFTEGQMTALGVANRYHVELRDVTADPMEPQTDWLVCVEVLEHLDDPVAFLRGLRRNMAPSTRAFITAALNAAHADHIYHTSVFKRRNFSLYDQYQKLLKICQPHIQ